MIVILSLLAITLTCALDLLLRLWAAGPAVHDRRLAGLQGLVDLEEVADLQEPRPGDLVDLGSRLPDVADGHREDLRVPALLVLHPEHPDRPGADQAAGERRLLD